jgi:2-oxoglutarate dehydrogenase E2 component (dihydrolipoamide succinyltransferase)
MAQSVDVVTPPDQEGTEAVVLRWCKRIGDSVNQHEPLLELETDKVTVEVPAPASGTLVEILKVEKDPVEPGTVLGRIDPGSGAAVARAVATEAPRAAPRTAPDSALLSPAVRRLLAEHNLDPAQIRGTGKDGRITAQDVLEHVEESVSAQRPSASDTARRPSVGQALSPSATGDTARRPAFSDSARVPPANEISRRPPPTEPSRPATATGASRHVPHSQMRKRIAAHMSASMNTAPHVTTVFEADMSRVVAHRQQHLREFELRGVKLTYTAYFVAAAVKALQAVPEVNATFHADSLEIFSDCNVGVGTALGNEGLIVPVIHRAQLLDLFSVARRLGELVEGARNNKLSPESVRGGTFTISNHGVSGSLVAAPIVINQPQIAVLGVGKLQRRVVVDEVNGIDSLSVRPMCYLSLTIDHRALDGYQANTFLTALVNALQSV